MSYSIEQLQGIISAKEGFARSNLFRVILPSLSTISETADVDVSASELNLYCKNVTLPGKQITGAVSRIGLINVNVPNGFANDPVTMTFRVFNSPDVLTYFREWRNTIINEDYEVGYYKDFVKPIKVQMLKKGFSFPLFNKQLNLDIPYSLRKALPSLGPINFAQNEIDIDLKTNDQVVYTYELIDAYPSTFTSISLSDDEQDGLIEITISFAFKDFKES